MLKAIRTLFGGRQAATPAATDELPAEVAIVIAGASFMDRGADEEGNPRLLVMTAHGTFRYSFNGARDWLRQAFPALNEAQTARAVKLLASRVAEFNRLPTGGERSINRWADWKPRRDSWMEV
ncbi:hypothetical protein [Burkholderia semiarida]|uniref:hypothetical protein n=1 Tax=Burkholderia semiarida TaxID=2843303 RepID=UPI0023DDF48E|nr:hypothetical protein [Burkholderia semiarida]MDF3106945.1 hypothetical protein [Burkholderia semiarida]